MNTATDNLIAVIALLFVFAAVALPSLVGLVHERRIDRQIREAQRPVRTWNPRTDVSGSTPLR